ncbi:extracellular calcium-sensing receptor-like [Bufo gargarizans]|uniref:extracellular calcium-sensing receptor-like n=1 Tax=Bufo gargarizans TaxID=30331 RepID=UPI001CF2CC49|nr:extracellular calcium-sensing receptor-like [Bufo gargarizans]
MHWNTSLQLRSCVEQRGPMWFRFEQYQQFHAMRFAVDEINNRPELLPNVSLGFYVYDSCALLQWELEGTLGMLTGLNHAIPNYRCRERPPLAAVIGHSSSTYSILMAHILGLYRYPQVSYFSTSSLLSDKTQFPSFFRTVPSDAFQSLGLAQMVKHFGWNWVGLIGYDNDYGREGIKVMKQEILRSGACLAFTQYISSIQSYSNIQNIAKVIKRSTTKVVVAFSADIHLTALLEEMLVQNVSGKIFVASDAWSISKILSVDRYSSILAGTIGFTFPSSNIKGFQEYLNNLLYYFKKVQVSFGNQRELFFNKNGDPPAMYDIVNWQRHPDGSMTQVKVGHYNTVFESNQSFTVNSSLIWWAHGSHEVPISICSDSCSAGFRKAPRMGEPICCFECVPCPQGEISNQTDSIDCSKCPWDMWPNNQKNQCLPKPIEYLSYDEPLGFTLTATSVSSSMVPLSILRLFYHYKNTPMIRANNYSLSCILLVSLTFCFLSSLAFIGYPHTEKCLLRQATFGMVFALCISCILAKTIMVFFAFMATKPESSLKRWISPQVSYMIIVCCSLLQLLLCVMWISTSPPFQQMNTESKPATIVIECNENSSVAFWSVLGYLGLLASISFIVAFLVRRLPDNFNEAKFITFSMLAFLSVWVSYVPASLSSQGKYTVAMEIFAIQSSSWALVICMFLPKCFIILFRPQMNTKEHLLGKNKSQK